MSDRGDLEAIFEKHDCTDFKWIDPESIVVANWVRMKCIFGCPEYGKNATCPPNTPSVDECEKFFKEFSEAVVFRFEGAVEDPEDRHRWTRKINLKLSHLERDLFISGKQKAFQLFIDPCNLCDDCASVRDKCANPIMARPSPEGMGIDVFSTVRNCGFPIDVLSDYSQSMNRYAFLLY